MFTLVYTSDGETCRHTLSAGDTVVGRAPVCDLAIDDPSISRRHARFRIHGDHCVVTDLGGRNGTFVDGQQVSEAEVVDGSAVVLGRFQIRVEHTSPAPAYLSDHYSSLLASPHTLFRRVDDETETGAGMEPAATGARVLLLLSQISRRLVHWGPLPEILDRIVAVAFETMAVERVSLLLIDPQTDEPVPVVVQHRDGTRPADATVNRTVVRKVIDDRVAVLVSDAVLESRVVPARRTQGGALRSFMCAPLWEGTEVLGVLYVDNPRSAILTPADLDILQALSSYSAAVIQQTRAAGARRIAEPASKTNSPPR
jgi:hypothetical protein